MVLAQPYIRVISPDEVYLFPSHYGSRSTVYRGRQWFPALPFPSHYGSRSTPTMVLAQRYLPLNLVFYRHSSTPTMVLAQLKTMRFHPTMVLAQRIRAERAGIQKWSFHPTMVLAQRILVCIYQHKHKRFHPTMVLAQPNRAPQRAAYGIAFPSHYGSRSTRSGKN